MQLLFIDKKFTKLRHKNCNLQIRELAIDKTFKLK